MNIRGVLAVLVLASTMFTSTMSYAATEIQWWHAFTGRLGELLKEQVKQFNESQSDYKSLSPTKGITQKR